MDDAAEQLAAEPADAPPPRGCSPRVVAVVLGGLCALVTLGVYIYFTSGPRLPEVDQARLDEARQLWRQNGPADYDVEVNFSGPEPAVYRVRVRGGKTLAASRNGTPLKDARTLGTWSVPGMFDTVQRDVEHSIKPIQINPREAQYVSPRAVFDPQYGYPARYRRIQWGSNMQAGWVVTKFEPSP